jgi:cytochrome P450
MIAGHETLQLYPHLWMFDRRGLGPDDLAGTKVAKGDLVIFCPHSIHRLPGLWSDPEAFRPERFEAGREEQKKKSPTCRSALARAPASATISR